MQTITDIAELRAQIATWRGQGDRIAFVPTMGNLHDGHLALVRRARALASRVVVSIFVNPLQFGPNEDFDSYPRTEAEDAAALQTEKTDLLFLPGVELIYPLPLEQTTRVQVPQLGDELCGASRPGHFDGVTTVVAKLFHLVPADVAVFGEKDFQQLAIVRKMVMDLNFPVRIEGVPTQREADGLAMSSRNRYLTSEERSRAPLLLQTLQSLAQSVQTGERNFAALETRAAQILRDAGFKPEYVSVRRVPDLRVPRPEDDDLVVLAAAWLGPRTRLIDNLRIRL